MRSELDVLYSEEQIASAVKRLGEEITRDYQNKDLAIVGVLKGSFIFLADLNEAVSSRGCPLPESFHANWHSF